MIRVSVNKGYNGGEQMTINIKKCGRLVLLSLCLLVMGPLVASTEETVDTWRSLYNRSKTIDQRQEVVRRMIEQDDEALAPVLIEILEELVAQRKILSPKDRIIIDDMKRLIIQELGELGANEAAALVYRVVEESENAIVRREALIALGKMGARAYGPRIATILENLNNTRGSNPADEEKIAYGCIIALELLEAPSGYKPVFRALSAGYSQMIVQTAERALNRILEDPTPMLRELITVESEPVAKVMALEQAFGSNAPERSKVEIAILGLREGLTIDPKNMVERTVFRELRKRALEILSLLEHKDVRAVEYIEEVLNLDTDDQEKLLALDALRTMPFEESVETLVGFLMKQNNRRAEGMRVEKERIIIGVIRTLADLGDRAAYEEILRTKFVGYSHDVSRAADAALEKLRS